MSVLRTRVLLREAIKQILEAGENVRAGEALEAEEREAKASFEKAQAELDRWDIEDDKRKKLLNKAQQLKIKVGDNKAFKDLKKDPKYAYDPKILQAKRETLVAKLDKTRDEYGAYDPSIVSYKRGTMSGGAKTPADMQRPDPKAKVYIPIGQIKPLRWYSWTDPRWSKGIKDVAFGSSKEKSGDEQSGTGPGEARLAKVFGGKVQGGGVSFDVVTPDDRRWEVKALETASTLIRPGTEGRAAFEESRAQLENIIKQIRSFNATIKKSGAKLAMDPVDKAVFQFVKNFVDDESDMFMKGEVSPERFKTLRATLKALAGMKKKWMDTGASDNVDTTIGLAKKKVKVDKPTFIDVAQRVEKAAPDVDVLSNLEEREVVLAILRDRAFDDPTEFLNDWFESVDVARVFEQVDGVFIVSSKGFNMVPKPLFRKAFKFKQVSQGVPRFAFVYYGGGDGAEKAAA